MQLDMPTNPSDELRNKLFSMSRLCGRDDNKHQCEQCTLKERLLCNSTASEVAGDVLSEMVTHFGRQERLMKETGLYRQFRDECERHMADHGDMSEAAAKWLAHPGDGHLAPRVAKLSDILGQWLKRHGEEHDKTLQALLKHR